MRRSRKLVLLALTCVSAAQGCASPVLIRIETRGGHGAGKPTAMQIEELADQWAFVEHALGLER